MKKIIFGTTIAIVTLLSAMFNASAAETGVQGGPAMISGGWANTSVWSLTSQYNSVKGSNTSVSFTGFGALSSAMQYVDRRDVYVKLYEYDVYPNADDLVKTYKGKIEGRSFTDIWVESYDDNGNIDSEGDPTAELYLSAYMSYVNGDSLSSDNRIFWYNIKVK